MRRVLMAVTATALAAATPAYADNLHGYCMPACPDGVSGHEETSSTSPVFGFDITGGTSSVTGNMRIDILVPTSLSPQPSAYSILMTGNPNPFTASLFSATAWSSGQLDTYLGLVPGASPTNPIGAYGTSFYVYQALLGSVNVPAQGGGGSDPSPYLSFAAGTSLLDGTYILAFLDTNPDSSRDTYVATPNSQAILEVGTPLPEPATWAMMLLGFGGMGMALRRSRRRDKQTLMQIA